MIKIGICVCTYKREKFLEELLNSFKTLNVPNNVKNYFIIVDNDKLGSAQEVTINFKNDLEIIYEIEPVKGISYARNRCIEICKRLELDYVAFVDDDEFVEKCWLISFLKGIEEFKADIVMGPIIPNYISSTPKWIIDGKFFERNRFETGCEISEWRTGNVLMKYEIIKDLRFDVNFALSGGEDTLFFWKLKITGAKIIWVDEAVVYENIPNSRMNIKWLSKRALRGGNTFVYCEQIITNFNLKYKFIRLIKSVVKIYYNFTKIIINMVLLNKIGIIKGILNMLSSLGQIAALLKIRIYEYI